MKIQKLLAIIGIILAVCAAVAGIILLIRHFSGLWNFAGKQYVCECSDDPDKDDIVELDKMEPLGDVDDIVEI